MATCNECVYYNGCISEWHKLSNIEHICSNFKTELDCVEVVRCKDCIYNFKSDTEGYFICSAMTNPNYVPLNHFCSYGERKEN